MDIRVSKINNRVSKRHPDTPLAIKALLLLVMLIMNHHRPCLILSLSKTTSCQNKVYSGFHGDIKLRFMVTPLYSIYSFMMRVHILALKGSIKTISMANKYFTLSIKNMVFVSTLAYHAQILKDKHVHDLNRGNWAISNKNAAKFEN